MLHTIPSVVYNFNVDHHLLYLEGTDSGGHDLKDYILNIIKNTGSKKVYNHAHEWCSGHGMIGYNILLHDICEHLTLSDVDRDSVISCKFTAAVNNIAEKVDIFQIDKFSDIPIPAKPWDLIVTNPPFVPRETFYTDIDQRKSVMWVDQDWQAHKNFFENVKKYIDPNCDIYMCGFPDFIQEQVDIADKNGFFLVSIHSGSSPQVYPIAHFCPA